MRKNCSSLLFAVVLLAMLLLAPHMVVAQTSGQILELLKENANLHDNSALKESGVLSVSAVVDGSKLKFEVLLDEKTISLDAFGQMVDKVKVSVAEKSPVLNADEKAFAEMFGKYRLSCLYVIKGNKSKRVLNKDLSYVEALELSRKLATNRNDEYAGMPVKDIVKMVNKELENEKGLYCSYRSDTLMVSMEISREEYDIITQMPEKEAVMLKKNISSSFVNKSHNLRKLVAVNTHNINNCRVDIFDSGNNFAIGIMKLCFRIIYFKLIFFGVFALLFRTSFNGVFLAVIGKSQNDFRGSIRFRIL